MDDLVNRLHVTAARLDEWVQKHVSTKANSMEAKLMFEAAARIEALEAQVRAADALADAIRKTGYRVDHNGVTTLTGIDAMIPINDALAAYRATKEGGAL